MPVNWGASPRSACNQHFSAAQGTRKHLNALIYDRVQMLKQEEAEEQGLTRQRTAEGEGSAPAEAAAEPAEAAAEMGLKTGTWKMPYDEGGPVATELSSMVNNKRTPSGNFFQTTNPSLWQDKGPGSASKDTENLTAVALRSGNIDTTRDLFQFT